MPDRLCAGGCGAKIPASNKSGFAWGHKNGCRTSAPPRTPETKPSELAVIEEPEIVEVPSVEISLTEPQLDRIWQTLSLHGKGTAIATVLATHE